MRKNVKTYFAIEEDIHPGVAGGAGQLVISQEIPAGYIYEIWDILAVYNSSVHLAGRLNIVESITAVFGGAADILKAPINFDPYKAIAFGTSITKHLVGEVQPICVIDNRDGVASIYLNVEVPIFVALALVADAITQEYGITITGLYYQ